MNRLGILLLISLFSSIEIWSQQLKERRVYYLDVTESMKGYNDSPNIWNDVISDLKKAIRQVNDQTTQLLVIPFSGEPSANGQVQTFNPIGGRVFYATEKDKNSLCSLIDKQSTFVHYTNICTPFDDYYNLRIEPYRVNYFFLLTDGTQNSPQQREDALIAMINRWSDITQNGQKHIYGFYVNLTVAAKSSYVESEVMKQPHLWVVNSANVNINIIRLQTNAVFNARNETYFDIPFSGNMNNLSFSVKFSQNSIYKVDKSEIENGKLRVYVSFPGKTIHELPPLSDENLSVKLNGVGQYDFLVTESIRIKCESKRERSLKVSVK